MANILDMLFRPNRFFPTDPKQLFSAVLWQFVIWLFIILMNTYGGNILNESRILGIVLLAAIFSSLFVYILSFTTQLGLFLLKKNHDYVPTFKVSVYSALVFSLYILLFSFYRYASDVYGMDVQSDAANFFFVVGIIHACIVQIVAIRQSHDVDMVGAAISVLIFWVIIAIVGFVAFSVNPEGFLAMAGILGLGVV